MRDLWVTFEGHLRHIGGPMGQLWVTSESLWGTFGGTFGGPLGDLWGTFGALLRPFEDLWGTFGGHLRYLGDL